MKIWIFTVCRNEEAMAPWFLRHYGQFADRILAWDAGSTDNTRSILKAHPSVSLFDWPGPDRIDENYNLHFAYDTYPCARGKADWCFWVDMDEIIYSPNLDAALLSNPSIEVAQTCGFNMASNGLPVNGYWHKQIWELLPMGVAAPVYSKAVVFRPETRVRWIRGKHSLEDCSPTVSDRPLVKLLHYRFLGATYTREKNAKNYERLGADKGAGWSCTPAYDGVEKEHSPMWADAIIPKAFNVLEAPL